MNSSTNRTFAQLPEKPSLSGVITDVKCVEVNQKTKEDLAQNIGTKDDEGKPNMCLLDTPFLEDMAKIMQYGLDNKYKRDNWKQPMDPERLLAAAYRHANDIQQGEEIDPESHLSHAAHMAVNAMMYAYQIKTYGND